MTIKPFDEVKTLSQAIQQALTFNTIRDSIGYLCQWEEWRHKTQGSESCYAIVIVEFLKVYGLDLDKLQHFVK